MFQDNILFNISIRENIRLGNLGATDEEVEAAARAAEIHKFLKSLPLGYDTIAGERGNLLSGGQRQRIAIARAIVRNPMPKTDATTYLRTVAIARIVLDNVPNLQSSWVTMGMKVGQMALRFGCNDFGSLMIEENVVSAANTTHRTTTAELETLIRDAGFTAARRRQDYSIVAHTDVPLAAATAA